MAKYKLPKRFKITKQIAFESSHLFIFDQIRNVSQLWLDGLEKGLIQIDRYLNLLKKIEEVELPKNYKILVEGISDRIMLTYNDQLVISDNNANLEKLVQEATKTTKLDLQIAALNNGEEIEL